MSDVQYSLMFEAITAIATLAVPVVVAVMANRFNSRMKDWEVNQWRNQELIKARLDYYKDLVPKLNDVMCYFTFIGPWKEFTPPTVIQMKRSLDRAFYCAAPLFSEKVQDAYRAFTAECFEAFGAWGTDAKLRTGFGRRRDVAGDAWDPSWERLFMDADPQPISPESVSAVRATYNHLIAAFAGDVGLLAAREHYVEVAAPHVVS